MSIIVGRLGDTSTMPATWTASTDRKWLLFPCSVKYWWKVNSGFCWCNNNIGPGPPEWILMNLCPWWQTYPTVHNFLHFIYLPIQCFPGSTLPTTWSYYPSKAQTMSEDDYYGNGSNKLKDEQRRHTDVSSDVDFNGAYGCVVRISSLYICDLYWSSTSGLWDKAKASTLPYLWADLRCEIESEQWFILYACFRIHKESELLGRFKQLRWFKLLQWNHGPSRKSYLRSQFRLYSQLNVHR